jgi:hypothetical protein
VTVGRVSSEDTGELDDAERASAEEGHERRQDYASVPKAVRHAEATPAPTEEELIAPNLAMKLPK